MALPTSRFTCVVQALDNSGVLVDADADALSLVAVSEAGSRIEHTLGDATRTALGHYYFDVDWSAAGYWTVQLVTTIGALVDVGDPMVVGPILESL